MIWKNTLRSLTLTAISIAISITINSCKNDKAEILNPGSSQTVNCNTVPAKFNADILPLFTSKCAISGCHDASGSGGMVFQNYNQISSAKSRIENRAIVQKSMPPTGALSASEIQTMKCWIDGGAKND